MNILIFNWKDTKHPQSGGAEIVTQEYAQNLCKLGHQVTIFTSQPYDFPQQEIINQVNIFRKGNFLTVYFWAIWYYFINKNKIDIVIDQIHGIPFFTPLYVKKPILAWIHEIAGPIWFYEYDWPVAAFGRLIEIAYLRIYRNSPFLVDCKSTQKELITYRLSPNNIHCLPLTISKPKIPQISKSKIPLLLYVGRVCPMKRLDILIKTAAILKKEFPRLKVIIAGLGKPGYAEYLQELISQNQLNNNVELIGSISESKKWQLYNKSWLHIQPSIREGFGLTVMEAATCNIPTVCFNVGGLKDLVKNNYNGIMVKQETAEDLANTISKLITDKKKMLQLQKNCLSWSKTFPTWEEQTKKLEKFLKSVIR